MRRGVADRRGARGGLVQGRVAQRNRRAVQRFEPLHGRLACERVIGGQEECLEATIFGRRRGSEAARTVLRPDIGAQEGHRFGAALWPGLARHEVCHLRKRDETGANDDHLQPAPRVRLGDPLPAHLAEPVGVGRARRMRLIDRQIAGRHVRIAGIQPEHRAAGAMDHAADADLKTGLEQVPGAHRVHLHGCRIVGDEGTIDAAQMDDDLDVAQCRAQRVEVAQINRIGRRRDVEHAHGMLCQLPHDVAPQPSETSGDRDVHALLSYASPRRCHGERTVSRADVRATSCRRSRGGTRRAPAAAAPRHARTVRTCRASASASV